MVTGKAAKPRLRAAFKGMTFVRLTPAYTGLFAFLKNHLKVSNKQVIVDAVRYFESLLQKSSVLELKPVVGHFITKDAQSIIAPVTVILVDGKIKQAHFLHTTEIVLDLPPSEKNFQKAYLLLLKHYNASVADETQKIVQFCFKKFEYVPETESDGLKGFLFDPPFVEKLNELSKKLQVRKSELIKLSLLLYAQSMQPTQNKDG